MTDQQVAAAKAVYDGPRDDKGQIFPGFPLGGEASPAGWSRWLTGGLKYNIDEDEFQGVVEVSDELEGPEVPSAFYGFGMGIVKYFIFNDPNWTYVDYDINDLRTDAGASRKR